MDVILQRYFVEPTVCLKTPQGQPYRVTKNHSGFEIESPEWDPMQATEHISVARR